MNPGEQDGSMLFFSVGPFRFCVEALEVEAVIEGQATTSIPLTPYSVEGVFLFRDHVTTVINLRRKFGLEELPAGETGQMLVTILEEGYVAFRVDEVSDLLNAVEISWHSPDQFQAGDFERFGIIGNQAVIQVEFQKLYALEDSGRIRDSLRALIDYSSPPEKIGSAEFVPNPDDKKESPTWESVCSHFDFEDILAETETVPGGPFFAPSDDERSREKEETHTRFSREVESGPRNAGLQGKRGQGAGMSTAPMQNTTVRAAGNAFQPQPRSQPKVSALPVEDSRGNRRNKQTIKLGIMLVAIIVLLGVVRFFTTQQNGTKVVRGERFSAVQSGIHSRANNKTDFSSPPQNNQTAARMETTPGSPGRPDVRRRDSSNDDHPGLEASSPQVRSQRPFSPQEDSSGTSSSQQRQNTIPGESSTGTMSGTKETREILRVDTKDFTMTVERPTDRTTVEDSPPDKNPGKPPGREETDFSDSSALHTSKQSTNMVPRANMIIYIVKKGDTLWDIADYYLGDPFRYPELAHLSHIKDPHWIYPGDQVKIIPKERPVRRSSL